ncbi:sigma-70 family RNA polymerase sigma factor [Streptomyces sp. NPDC060198]|uniref:sigma-70 family RNA polymerase sigma factor n=1 Tax=Streptomyces sp. NPDC060198 TaxID=3347070 RepID=UPI0036482AF9
MTERGTYPEEDVTALAYAARDGDRRATERLVALHLPLVYGIVGRALNGHSDAEDLVQETMLRVVRGLPKLREPDRFRSWAVAIAYREIQQYQRRAAGGNSTHRDVESVPDPLPDFAERTVAELALTGQRRHLARATRWLEPADRQVLALYWEEASGRLTRSEVAASLGLDRRHTAVRVQRMKERLEAARTLVHALVATPRCPGLQSEASGWDGTSSALWRKRLTRHVRDCPQCRAHGGGLVPPENLLPGIGLVAVPAALLVWLRETAARAGAPTVPARAGGPFSLAGSKAKAVAVVAAAGIAAGTLGLLLWQSPASPPPASSAPPAPVRTRTLPSPSSADDVAALSLYVAPDGSDGGDGSLAHPFATLGKAVGLVRPGGTVLMRGGTYRPAEAVDITTDADATHRITLANYPGESPVVDASGVPEGSWAITQTADYWTVRGLEIRGSRSHAYVCRGCAHTVFQNLSLHDNAESGLTLRDAGTEANSVLDSDFYANRDADGRGGVGLAIKFGSGAGNLVKGCRTYDNADEGVDLGGFTSPVTVESNWSFGNGNGFTLGGGNTRAAVAHVVRNNAAWENAGLGFTDEGNPGRISLTRNTAYRNGVDGFHLTTAAALAEANVAAANGRDAALGDGVRSSGNSWDGGGTARFTSTDPDSARAPRAADGALPRTAFLAPRAGTGTAAGATMTVS